MRHPSESTFFTWLKKQKKRNDVVGDLSRDFIRDTGKYKSINDFKEYLICYGACDGAMEAIRDAILEWRKFKINC